MALEESYSASGVIPINTVVFGPVDADASSGLSVQVKSMGTSGAIQVQESMDGVVWTARHMQNTGGSVGVTSMTVAGMWWCNLVARYYRIVVTVATTAGTTDIRTRLSDDEFSEMGSSITVAALPSIPAGTAVIGVVTSSMSASQTLGPAWLYHKITSCAATTNATSVKTSAGRLAKIHASSATATARYLKLYNKASVPVVGTDTPIMTFMLRGTMDIDIDMADLGFYFSTGIAYAITSGVLDSDTGACAAGDVVALNLVYI